jgi:hypothetical protein
MKRRPLFDSAWSLVLSIDARIGCTEEQFKSIGKKASQGQDASQQGEVALLFRSLAPALWGA